MRANRSGTETGEGQDWTYNHAPMLAYWQGAFHLQYLSNPRYEHVAPGRTLLCTSPDGRTWSEPRIVFPEYALGGKPPSEISDLVEVLPSHAVMHQRMGFRVTSGGRLLTLGFYGFSPKPENLPFNRRGIGRVVREIRADQSLGEIYFVRYNRHAGWNESNTRYPFYKASPDAGFVAACDELLDDPLLVQQWCEEQGDDDLVPLRGAYKAFCHYTLPDRRTVGLWKWSLAGISPDRGRTWESLGVVPSVANAGGKIWGQRTGDGRYALVYNPTTNNKHRWPLAMVTGEDGLAFRDLRCVCGHVAKVRYAGGPHKDFGQNYVRGIPEGDGAPPDGAMWVAYSMNKEDIWVCRVLAGRQCERSVADDFSVAPEAAFARWNVSSPRWAPVRVGTAVGGAGCLALEDAEPADGAIAERVFVPTRRVAISIRMALLESGQKPLYVEIGESGGNIPVRFVLFPDGALQVSHGRRNELVGKVEVRRAFELRVQADAESKRFSAWLDGRELAAGQTYQGEQQANATWFLRAPAVGFDRLSLRTMQPCREITPDTEVESAVDAVGTETRLPRSRFGVLGVMIEPVR